MTRQEGFDVLFEALGSHDLAVARVSGGSAIVCGQLPNSRHSTVLARCRTAPPTHSVIKRLHALLNPQAVPI